MTHLISLQSGEAKLLPSLFKQRQEHNLRYVMSLNSQNLLRPYLFEAGLWGYSGSSGTTIGAKTSDGPATWHWGWESLTCQLRGHILGHWLSAAGHLIAQTGNIELKAKAYHIVSELKRCQIANGGQWLGPFPETVMHDMAAGKDCWAPHYVLHKLLAGLMDIYLVGDNEEALDMIESLADWLFNWSSSLSQEQWDDVLDYETGGMMEVWAELYSVTGIEQHLQLMHRYERRRLFDRLLAGEDVLTNKHANTQIPEILGAALAFEVTEEERYRQIVEAFWKAAVTERGTYVTGGGSCGEVWQPPFSLNARLHAPHEHCTVYNMMRLANYLFRWTGDKKYADYWERNFLNAILAQQHPDSGMVSYFLPLGGESQKKWGSPTDDFWCCHGTLMQAHSSYHDCVLFTDPEGLIVSQYLPSHTNFFCSHGFIDVTITQDIQQGLSVGQRFSSAGHKAIQVYDVPIPPARPDAYVYDIELIGAKDHEFTLKLRVPDWVRGEPTLLLNDEKQPIQIENGYLVLHRSWDKVKLRLTLPKTLTVEPLPDAPDTVAFMDGPLVLAGICPEERLLIGDISRPETMLQPDQERHHGWWHTGYYRTRGQERGFRFIPLCEVRDETYCVYFPVRI